MPDGIWVPGSPVIDVQPSPAKDYITPDGRRFIDSEITLTPEAADKLWKGYACAHCLEGLWERPLPESFPKQCPVCGFPMKRLQRELLERDFLGHDPTVVGGFPLEREREHLARQHYKPKGLMTVPKELKK